MKKYVHLKEKAIELREGGSTLNDLCGHFSGIAKTTIYYWIRKIPVKRTAQSEAQRKGTKAIIEKYRKLRKEAYEDAHKKAGKLLSDKFLRDFILIYLTEGFRRNRNVVEVGNSKVTGFDGFHRM